MPEAEHLAMLATAELEKELETGLAAGTVELTAIDVPTPPPPVEVEKKEKKRYMEPSPKTHARAAAAAFREPPADVVADVQRKRAKVTLCPPLWLGV